MMPAALVADARPRCRCDTWGVAACPAGCGAQRDRLARAELRRREDARDEATKATDADRMAKREAKR